MSRASKLVLLLVLIVSSAGWLAYVGGASSWQYYVTSDECLRDAAQLVGKRLRVQGTIGPGSLQIAADRQSATFDLEATTGRIEVTCDGPLPDNLRESIDVVVEGTLDSPAHMHGIRVLTRCASKYERQKEAANGQIE